MLQSTEDRANGGARVQGDDVVVSKKVKVNAKGDIVIGPKNVTAAKGTATTTFNFHPKVSLDILYILSSSFAYTPDNNTINVNGNMVDLTLTAKWEGAKLHCSTWVNLQGQGFEIVLNLSLDEKGNLVSEHITPAMGNNNPGGTEVTKYKKAQ